MQEELESNLDVACGLVQMIGEFFEFKTVVNYSPYSSHLF